MSKIVMVGCLESGWQSVKGLLEAGIHFDYFVGLPESVALKNKVSGYKSFEDLAVSFNIPFYACKSYGLTHEEDISFFKQHKFDLLVQGGWQRLFPESILNELSIGAIGIHGSSGLLPKGRGRSPINWSLIEGRERFIIHYFLIKPGVDDGDVFHHESFDINVWDDCKTVYYKNSIVTIRTLTEWIPKLLAGKFKVKPQLGDPSYYSKRVKEDGLINWNSSLKEIYNLVRGITKPYPGAFTMLKDKEIMVWKAQPFDTRIVYAQAKIGEVVECFENGDIIVNCIDGLMLVTQYDCEVQVKKGNKLE
jgi:methionyl-tRNA formyltransferase